MRPVQRIDRRELQVVLEALADAVEGVAQQVGHREHGRAGVEGVATAGDVVDGDAGATAGNALPLQERHLPACSGETERRGETSQSGTHHDNPVGGTDYGAHGSILDC